MRNVNFQSLFTSILTSSDILKNAPMTVLDVGARNGPQPHWPLYGKNISVLGFEPDKEECDKLNKNAAMYHVPFTCLSVGLSNKNYTARLYEYGENKAANSLLPPPGIKNPKYKDIKLVRFDDYAVEKNIKEVDFVKIDIEWHELEALEGMVGFLSSQNPILGLEVEVHFGHYKAKPQLSEIEMFLRPFGYSLVDIDIYKMADAALPSLVAWDHRNHLNEPVSGPTITGRMNFGDALFVLDTNGLHERPSLEKNVMRMLKLASLYEMYGLSDITAGLLLCYASLFEPVLKPYSIKDCLKHMVPDYYGKGLSYDEYMAAYKRNVGRPAGSVVQQPEEKVRPLSLLRRIAGKR